MKKMISMMLFILLLSTTGCGWIGSDRDTSSNNSSVSSDEVDDSGTKLFTDMAGIEVEVPSHPKRVICISPTYTEYMVAFNLQDILIGTHKNSVNKVWLKKICPQISDLQTYGYSATAEEILAADADLVIVTQNNEAEILRNAGIPAVTMTLDGTKSPYYHVELFAQLFGNDAEQKAASWEAETSNVIKEIQNQLKSSGNNSSPTVYMINGQSNKGLFYAQAGGGSAMEGFINAINANFAMTPFDGSNGIMPTEEEILQTNPDFVFIGGAFGVPLCEEMYNDPVWAEISAVKNKNVYNTPIGGVGWDQDYLTMPIALKFFANKIYPDVFDYDIIQTTKDYYLKYYNISFTDQEIDYMMNGRTPDGKESWK